MNRSNHLLARRRHTSAKRNRKLLFEQFETRQLLAGVWDGGGGDNNWHTPANWDDDQLPGAATNVSIGAPFAGVTITSASNVTVNSITSAASLSITAGTFSVAADSTLNNAFNFSGGILTGAGNVTIVGAMTWTGGIMSGSGQTTTSGSLAITANNSAELAGRTLNINGNTTLSGANFWRGNNGAVINNAGVFDVQSDVTFLHASAAGPAGALSTFNNTGTFQKSGGTGVSDVGFVFNNSNNIHVNTGTLSLNAGGTSTGNFTVAGTLGFGGGTHNLNLSAGNSISGAGTVRFSGGTTNLSGGTYNVTGSTQANSGSANFNAGVNLLSMGATLNVANSFGTINFSSGEAINVTTLNLSAGTLSGSDNITVSGATNWTGGIMSGSGTTTTNGSLAIQANNSSELAARTLNINGGAAVTAVGGFPNFRANSGAVINNTGLFDVQSDATLLHASAVGANGAIPTFNNTGTFRKSGGAGVANVDFVFNSTSAVEVNAGTLSLNAGGTSTGSFTTSATLAFGGGTHDINAHISGAGTVRFSGGTTNLNGGTYNVGGGTQATGGTTHFNAGVNLVNVGAALIVSPAFGSLNFNSGEAINPTTLNMDEGVLSGTDNVTISGAATWSGGIMRGSGLTTTGGSLALTANNSTELDGRTLNINGSTTLTGTSNFRGSNGAVVNNAGLFDVQSDAVFLSLGGTPIFNNLAIGTFRKSGGTGVTNVGFVFNNSGGVQVNVGALLPNAGGTSTGDWAVAAAGELRFSATAYLLDNGTDITGAGMAHILGATVNAGDAAADVVNAARIKLTSGFLQGAGALNVSESFHWDAGTMTGSGTTTLLSGATGTITSGGDKFLGRTLVNQGTINQTGINFIFGVSSSPATGVINNSGVFNSTNASPIILQGQSQSTTHAFNNAGTFNRLGTDATQFIGIPFNNSGNVDVQAGSLQLEGGGNSSGSFDVGGATLRFGGTPTTLTTSSSIIGAGVLEFGVGTATVDGTLAMDTLRLSGGTVNLNSNAAVINLEFPSGGTLQGSGNVNVIGALSWPVGVMAGSGTTTLLSGATATIPGFGDMFLGRTLVNQGTINHSADHFAFGVTGSPATGVINNSGVFNSSGSSPLLRNGQSQSTSHAFNNAGTYNRLGAGTTEITGILFTNSGTANVLAGGTLSLNGGFNNFSGTSLTGGVYSVTGTLKFPGADIVTNAATIVLDGPTSQIVNQGNASGLANFATNAAAGSFTIQSDRNFVAAGAFSNAGAVTIAAASTFSTAAGNYTQTGGTTTVQGTLDPAGDVSIQGGTLAGTGNVLSNTINAGMVTPGTSPGALTVTGDYSQAAAGALAIEIGGVAAAAFDQLHVSGLVNLGGSLNVSLLGGFVPNIGDSFRILNKASAGAISGTFAGLNEGATFPVGQNVFHIAYAGGAENNDIVLTAVNIAPTLDPIVDPVAILEDALSQTVNLSGIAAGSGQTQVLTVTATSDNPGLIPNPTVTYTSANASGSLAYAPAANKSGTAIITVTVKDDGGTANGGVDTLTRTFAVTVTPVNDEPAGVNQTRTILEDATYIFAETDFPLTDPSDSPPVGTGPASLLNRVRIATLPTSGALTLNGAAIAAGDFIPLASITGGLLRYTPANNASSPPSVAFTFQVEDNGGTANSGVNLDQSANSFAFDITPINDTPAGENRTISASEDVARVFTVADFPLTDVNDAPANTLAGVQVVTLPAAGAGSLLLGGAAVTAGQLIPVASFAQFQYQPPANLFGPALATFTFRVQDNGGTVDGGIDLAPAPNSLTINVTSVNDAPAGANRTVSAVEDAAFIFAEADFGFGDPNDTPPVGTGPANILQAVRITTLPAIGTLTNNGVNVTPGQSISAADLTAGNLRYRAPLDQNGAALASFTFQVQDSGGTAAGGVDLDQSANALTIDVAAVNDEPAGANNTVSVLEDVEFIFTEANVGFNDPNDTPPVGTGPANTLQAVRITTLPGSGTLRNNGAAVTAGQLVSVGDIAAGQFRFQTALNATGNTSFTFQVQDSGGTASGGVNLDASPNTINLNVTAVNDAPAGTDGSLTVSKNTDKTITRNDFGFSDLSDTPSSAFQAVRIASLPAAGTLRLSGAAVAAGQFVSTTDIDNNLLTYRPQTDFLSPPVLNFGFQVQDNGGTANGGIDLDPTANTLSLNVTDLPNSAPSGVNNTVTALEDTDYAFRNDAIQKDFPFTDAEGNSLLAVRITTLPTTGTLTVSGVNVTAGQSISAADITAGNLRYRAPLNQSGTALASFTFQVQDNGGTTLGGIDLDPTANSLTIDVTPINDAPAGQNRTKSILEDAPYTFVQSDFPLTDAFDTPPHSLAGVTITTLPVGGTLNIGGSPVTAGQVITLADVTSGQFVFSPTLNLSGTSAASFAFQVQDNGGTANGGDQEDDSPNTFTFDISSVNDAPSGASASVSTAEDTPFVFAAADFGFTDPNDNPPNAFLAVQIASLPTAGTLRRSGAAVTLNQFISVADINAGLFDYLPPLNQSGSPLASFTFRVQDNGGTANSGIDLDPTTNTITVNVSASAANDEPSGANNTVTTLEDTAYSFSVADFPFSDPSDSPPNSLLAVKITTLPASGTLRRGALAVTAGQIIPVGEIPQLLFQPAPNSTVPVSFTFQVQDAGGTAGGGQDTDQSPSTLSVSITAVNDAPDGANATLTTTQDSARILSRSDFGFSDSNDSPPNDFAAVLISTALAGQGLLTLNGALVTATQTITVADINNNLLRYTPPAGGAGANLANFTFRVQDNGGTTNGGVNLDPAPNTIQFTVTPVVNINDAPSGANSVVTLLEDAVYVLQVADFGFSDPLDSPPNNLQAVRLASLPAQGSLTVSGSAVTVGQFVQISAITGGNFRFTPAANANGAANASFTFQVQDNGGTANGGADTDQSPNALSINVTPVNDAPALDSIANPPAIQADAGLQTVNLVGISAGGGETQAITVIASSSNPGLIPNPAVTYASPGATGSLSYAPVANQSGTALITVTATDNGGMANGGVDTITRTFTVTVLPGGAPTFDLSLTNRAAIVADPINPGQKVLLVVGSAANDAILVELRPSNGIQIRVKRTGKLLGIFNANAAARIAVFGLGGNDSIVVDSRITKGAELHGGAGNDSLFGAAGRDVLFGEEGNDNLRGGKGNDKLFGGDGNDSLFAGDGNDSLFGEFGADRLFGDAGSDLLLGGLGDDRLTGGSGRDFLIGGLGVDRLQGGEGEDLLVGDWTTHDENEMALLGILAEWNSRRPRASRVLNLADGTGSASRLNDSFFLKLGSTVFDDFSHDQFPGLNERGQRDWKLP